MSAQERSYWRVPLGRAWHAHDGTDPEDWRALCGRLPTRFSENSLALPAADTLCSLCRQVARNADRDDALYDAEVAQIAADRHEDTTYGVVAPV